MQTSWMTHIMGEEGNKKEKRKKKKEKRKRKKENKEIPQQTSSPCTQRK
jgi:hypothetical protein